MNRHPHIILVEDDPVSRMMFTAYLAHALPMARVSPTSDGAEALALFHERGADLILSDCFLPEMSGLVLTLRLRADGATFPIVLMSSGDKFAAQAALAGATTFISKQHPGQIIATVVALLTPSGHALQRDERPEEERAQGLG